MGAGAAEGGGGETCGAAGPGSGSGGSNWAASSADPRKTGTAFGASFPGAAESIIFIYK